MWVYIGVYMAVFWWGLGWMTAVIPPHLRQITMRTMPCTTINATTMLRYDTIIVGYEL